MEKKGSLSFYFKFRLREYDKVKGAWLKQFKNVKEKNLRKCNHATVLKVEIT